MSELSDLQDRIAIGETKARYCRCLDTKDWDGYGDCFTEDLVMDNRPAGGILTEGRDASVAMARAAVGLAKTSHHVHSPEITLHGDTADVVWAMQDRVVWGERKPSPDVLGHTGFGHYTEQYRRCADGRWRIARQTLSRLHTDNDYV